MSTTDFMIDRRRLRRKLGFWRLAAIGAALAAALVGVGRLGGAATPDRSTQHIARLPIQGLITGDKDTLDLIKQIDESQAKAVLVTIESPGGTTTGSERLYDALRRLGEKKPVVAVVGTMAASGGYIVALSAEQIFAYQTSLVGSIGVLFQYPNLYKALDSLGVKVEEIKSSPLKAAPNGLEPTSDAARAAIASLVADSYSWFKGLVKERRRLTDAELAAVADGRVFTAHQGLPLKLVDELGGEREAIAWLETHKNVPKGLSVRDWKKKRSLERLGLVEGSAALARFAGFEQAASFLEQAAVSTQSSGLDGLLAIWQFPNAN